MNFLNFLHSNFFTQQAFNLTSNLNINSRQLNVKMISDIINRWSVLFKLKNIESIKLIVVFLFNENMQKLYYKRTYIIKYSVSK